MKEHETTKTPFTDRQQRLLVELVRTSDIKAAATAANIGRTTAYRWMNDPAFCDELMRLRSQSMNEALASIKSMTMRAAQTLSDLLDSGSESIRRMVCKDILSHAIKVREMEDIEQRLAALERQIKDQEVSNER